MESKWAVKQILIGCLCLVERFASSVGFVSATRTPREVQRRWFVEFVLRSRTGENNMNRKIFSLSMATLLLSLAVGYVAAQAQSTYAGTVTASQIASTGSLGLWMKHLNCHDEADCARRLVQAGGKYVLVTPKGVFELSDQRKAEQFAGMRVTVSGTLTSPQKRIEVAEMQPYNSPAASASLQ
jgi:hypothetical protein